MTAPRVVLDTNVLVSALVFQGGTFAWLRAAWQAGTIRPLAGHATLAELIRVLQYPKFRLSGADREDLLGDYLPWCETVTIPADITLPACRDPFDRPFLALALEAEADALVTGDGDLLALAGQTSIPILTPAELRAPIVNRRGAAPSRRLPPPPYRVSTPRKRWNRSQVRLMGGETLQPQAK